MRFRVIDRLNRYFPWFIVGVSIVSIASVGWAGWGSSGTHAAESPAPAPVVAQSQPSAAALVRQGLDRYAAGRYNEAIALWEQARSQSLPPEHEAIVRSNLARAYRQIGELDRAISDWERAREIYATSEIPDATRDRAKLSVEQAQAYSDLGQHQRAIDRLQGALELARDADDSLTEIGALGALGNAYWAAGNYSDAIDAHRDSLALARQLDRPREIATALNNLGNAYHAQVERLLYQANIARLEGEDAEAIRLTERADNARQAALEAARESVRASREVGGMTRVRALLNYNRRLQQWASEEDALIDRNRQQAIDLLQTIPDSRDKVFALVGLASQWTPPGSDRAPVEILRQAIASARAIGDRRAESFALGTLGTVYERTQAPDRALEFTRKAEFAAQQVNAADSLYRWQWQAGRLFRERGETERAIAVYREAIATLQSIRSDIIAANKDLQFDFRDSVEPVYRELIGLLLDTAAARGKKQENIREVLDVLELLKLAELQNYFGDECVEAAREGAAGNGQFADTGAAIAYSVILEDRTYQILQFPDGALDQYPIDISARRLQGEVDRLRSLLEKRSTNEYLGQAQKLYDLLVRPWAGDLEAAGIDTLVFIQDGILRTIPMAALHDGERFLIENYAIATTPSLTLTSDRSFSRRNMNALILGLTVERPPFEALTNVPAEVSQVQQILGGTKLIDDQFTLAQFQKQLHNHSYPIVHLATHGKFGIDSDSTFLLAFDTRITIDRIDSILRSPQNKSVRSSQGAVELLTLSACQTAAGDNRSALGIAGVAVRAGVKSALASLWYINDRATVPLIEEFYTQLRQPGITKAQALRHAQIKLIQNFEYQHPAVWSPFILIGNWM